MELVVHRVPFSTNVERVALAAGHKGLPITWIDHPWDDRSGIRAVSGQDLAPVLVVDGDEVVIDSPVILRRLEAIEPDPPLWPADPARRARADVFVEWFNGVWKGPPNRLADGTPQDGDAAWLRASADVIEGLLQDGPFLDGDAMGVSDVVAFPFVTYGRGVGDGDEDPFHAVLADHLVLGRRTVEWCARMDAAPRS